MDTFNRMLLYIFSIVASLYYKQSSPWVAIELNYQRAVQVEEGEEEEKVSGHIRQEDNNNNKC